MSKLKYRLLDLLPSLSSQARTISEAETKARFKLIKSIAESEKSVLRKCAELGKSHQMFYKWAKILLRSKDILSLKSRSRKPKRSPNLTPKRIVKRVRRLRKLEPFRGSEPISRDLKKYYNMNCPPSTVNKVLKREGLITKEHSKKLTKRHMKRYRRPWPGYLQMDFKYVPYLIESRQLYQLSCVDHHSSWRMIRVFDRKDEASVMAFMAELEIICPFKIIQLQTDNDTAFTDKFSSQKNQASGRHALDWWCAKEGVEHRLIPVGEKEINGKVENTHKWDDREFFSQIQCLSLASLQAQTRLYNDRWNTRRETKALGWKTPELAIWESYVRALAYLKIIEEKFYPNRESKVKMTEEGDFYLPTPKPNKIKKRIKKKSALDRYLQYLDWEDKQRIKSLVPLVAMSQFFSVVLSFRDFCRTVKYMTATLPVD